MSIRLGKTTVNPYLNTTTYETTNDIVLTSLSITPKITQQVFSPNLGEAYNSVTISGVSSSIDSNIVANNIREGITILGVTGTLKEITVTEPVLQTKEITPKTTAQTVTADFGYDALEAVYVSAVDASIDSNIKASNIKEGVTILGITGTLPENVANPVIYSITEPENATTGTIWFRPI